MVIFSSRSLCATYGAMLKIVDFMVAILFQSCYKASLRASLFAHPFASAFPDGTNHALFSLILSYFSILQNLHATDTKNSGHILVTKH